jgi:hypothetical protein
MSNVQEFKVTNAFDACNIIENFFGEEFSEEQILAAWQFLVDTGIVWSLQGTYGRMAKDLINAGIINPA